MSKGEASHTEPGNSAPDALEIARAGWTILHTTAAAFPNSPTPQQKSAFIDFIQSWSQVYPCSVCAFHMRMHLKTMPIKANSKREASVFVCELHNRVNSFIGRPVANCDPEEVLRRWHPTYPDVSDETSPEEQLEMHRMETRRATGPFGLPFGPGSSSAGRGPPATETEINDLVRRVKPCRAFCPEKKL